MTSKISIITASYNAANTIRSCLDSVNDQTHQPIEHIIVDGDSTDGTTEHISGFKSQVSDFITVSEPDDGIYDAMNKGLKLATGDIIGILNADDFYADDHVLEKIAETFKNPDVDVCYGDLLFVDPDNSDKTKRYWQAKNHSPNDFYWGWMPPHPTFFVRRTVYEKYGDFKLNLGTSADYELMLRFLLKQRIKSAYIPETLVHMRAGGASNISLKNRLAANRMDRMAWKTNGLKPYPWTLTLKPLRKIGQWLTR